MRGELCALVVVSLLTNRNSSADSQLNSHVELELYARWLSAVHVPYRSSIGEKMAWGPCAHVR